MFDFCDKRRCLVTWQIAAKRASGQKSFIAPVRFALRGGADKIAR
jgi:hypothetical protein